MKKIVFLFSFIAISATVFSQKISLDNVPATVKSTFSTKFEKAERVSWEMDYENYNVDFYIDKVQMFSVIDKDGRWIETETYMLMYEMPKAVKDAIFKEFGELSGWKYEESKKVEVLNQDMYYSLVAKKGDRVVDVAISEAGKLINKEDRKE